MHPLTALSWRGGVGHVGMVVADAIALLAAIFTFRDIAARHDFRAAWGLVALLILAAVPFAYQFRLDRFDRSGFGQARALREYVGGTDAPILTGAVLHSLPNCSGTPACIRKRRRPSLCRIPQIRRRHLGHHGPGGIQALVDLRPAAIEPHQKVYQS